MTTAMKSFGGWGYREIQVPLLHYFEALRPGLDHEQIDRSFRFVDRDGSLVVIRPDITPIIAQTFAQMRSPNLPLRISYTHKVVRVERSFTRNELESYQLGIEHLGSDEALADLEVLMVALEVLGQLELPNYQVSIADHEVAKYLLKTCGAPPRMRDKLRGAVIARDVNEVGGLLKKLGTRDHFAQAILALASVEGGRGQLVALAKAMPEDPVVQARTSYLMNLDSWLNELGFYDHVHLDLAELSGPRYYTGLAFSLTCAGASRELGRGGRYDKLTGKYGRSVPAVGFSLSLETVLDAMNSRQITLPRYKAQDHRMVVDQAHVVDHMKEALAKRAQGKPVELVRGKGGPR